MAKISIAEHFPFNDEYYEMFVDQHFRELTEENIAQLSNILNTKDYDVELCEGGTIPQETNGGVLLIPKPISNVKIHLMKSYFDESSMEIYRYFLNYAIGPMLESTLSRVLKFDLLYNDNDVKCTFACSSLIEIIEDGDNVIFNFIPAFITEAQNLYINKKS